MKMLEFYVLPKDLKHIFKAVFWILGRWLVLRLC